MSDVDNFCSHYCSYYKSSKDKTVYCMAYSIAKHFMKLSEDVPVYNQIDIRKTKSIESLTENICPQCLFYEKDCDFALSVENALPCGGLVFLTQLLKEGRISLQDIDKIKN